MVVTKDLTVTEPPMGQIYIMDSSPLNWLFILFNTMEEAVGADHLGRIIPSLAKSFQWIDETTLQLELRDNVIFHNNEYFTANHVLQSFYEVKPWISPHPPGTWINLPGEMKLEKVDMHTVRLYFPKPDGLALGKLRSYHFANNIFWRILGFGYKKLGTAEGHW